LGHQQVNDSGTAFYLKFPDGIRRSLCRNFKIGGTLGWPDYDEQIIARAGARVQPQAHLWFPTPSGMPTRTLPELFKSEARRGGQRAKKRAAVSGGFKVDNREASNRVDRSHSVSKEDSVSHI
jgi:hypothetical protein